MADMNPFLQTYYGIRKEPKHNVANIVQMFEHKEFHDITIMTSRNIVYKAE